MVRTARMALLITQAFVAVTASAGGLALILGSVNPSWGLVLVPPAEYLEGSPFTSYTIPGLLLIVGVAGVHVAAFVLTLSGSRWAAPLSAAGGFACLIWIFVQMLYIPFSILQALYFAVGMGELGLTMVMLGILDAVTTRHRTTYLASRPRMDRARG